MRKRLALFFKTAGKLGWGGMVLALFLFGVTLLEHLLEHNIAGYLMMTLAALSFAFGAYCAWDVEHQKLIIEKEQREAEDKAHSDTAIDLRAHIHDLQSSLADRGKELERAIDKSRPEVFATYSGEQLFKFRAPDPWTPEDRFICPDFVEVTNSGESVAYQIELAPVSSTAFTITFGSLAQLGIGKTAKISAALHPFDLQDSPGELLFSCATQDAGGGMALYQTIGVGESKQVEVGTGLQLKVMWRDSSRNHFFSKSKEGEFLFIERMEAPITEDEMREAYEQVEDYE